CPACPKPPTASPATSSPPWARRSACSASSPRFTFLASSTRSMRPRWTTPPCWTSRPI
ncbi:MAG: hypothetical protein AVDCRST_MAG08-364, partial [uncultured Acetobacteraceae bacterium]